MLAEALAKVHARIHYFPYHESQPCLGESDGQKYADGVVLLEMPLSSAYGCVSSLSTQRIQPHENSENPLTP